MTSPSSSNGTSTPEAAEARLASMADFHKTSTVRRCAAAVNLSLLQDQFKLQQLRCLAVGSPVRPQSVTGVQVIYRPDKSPELSVDASAMFCFRRVEVARPSGLLPMADAQPNHPAAAVFHLSSRVLLSHPPEDAV